MSAIGPYSQSYDLRHTYDFSTVCREINRCYNKNSLTGFIMERKEYSLFAKILNKSGLASYYDDPQENATLFVPRDDTIEVFREHIENIDIQTARTIIKKSSLNKRIPVELFKCSRVGIYPTKDRYFSVIIECINDKIIVDKYVNVLESNIQCSNGIIHIVDNILFPGLQL